MNPRIDKDRDEDLHVEHIEESIKSMHREKIPPQETYEVKVEIPDEPDVWIFVFIFHCHHFFFRNYSVFESYGYSQVRAF